MTIFTDVQGAVLGRIVADREGQFTWCVVGTLLVYEFSSGYSKGKKVTNLLNDRD